MLAPASLGHVHLLSTNFPVDGPGPCDVPNACIFRPRGKPSETRRHVLRSVDMPKTTLLAGDIARYCFFRPPLLGPFFDCDLICILPQHSTSHRESVGGTLKGHGELDSSPEGQKSCEGQRWKMQHLPDRSVF